MAKRAKAGMTLHEREAAAMRGDFATLARVAAPVPEVAPMQQLLQEIAESEHHARHPDEFKDLVEGAGYKLAKADHRWEVKAKKQGG